MAPWFLDRVRGRPSSPASSSSTPAPSKKATAKNAIKTSLILLEKAVDGLNIPGLKGAAGSIVELIKIAEKRKQNKDALEELVGYLRRLEDGIITPLLAKQHLGVSKDLEGRVRRLIEALATLANDWTLLKASHSRLLSLINHEDYTAEIARLNKLIKEALDTFVLDNQISNTMVVESTHKIATEIKQHQLSEGLRDLPHAKAAYNSITRNNVPTCFEGTRTSVFEGIGAWANNKDSPGRYVVVGIAGVGKTTIAQTLAKREAEKGRVAATHFFSRDVDERKKADIFFCTIAYQLALHNEDFANRIARAFQKSPNAPNETLVDQLKKLIVEPLEDVEFSESHPILIVLDALDECEETGASEILKLLFDHLPFFKILITTRPESHIMAILNSQQNAQQLILHDVDTQIVEEDIRRYLEHNLTESEVQKSVPGCTWVLERQDLDELTKAAGKLFIIASTVEKLIKDKIRGNPRSQLRSVLQAFRNETHSGPSPFAMLDQLYRQILDSALPPNQPYDVMIEYFQGVIGSIIILQNPLPASSLTSLLNFDEDDVNSVLNKLQSVIALGSEDQTPRVYHPSFPDFIVNPKRCTEERFLIEPRKHHRQIASRCFEVMKQHLQRNICDIPMPYQYLENTEMVELPEKIKKHIPAELTYACCYWATHLDAAVDENMGLMAQLETFAFNHLLFWLEVLSLTGNMRMGYTMLLQAEKFVITQGGCTRLSTILNDGQRMIMASQGMMKKSALHVYYSALAFTPSETTLFKQYKDEAEASVKVLQGVEKSWDPLLAVLAGHDGEIRSVAFSSDGKRLASGSEDKTVRMWDGATGAHVATLTGHHRSITSVAFSSDGKRLASGSEDKTVRMWDGATGAHVATLTGHHGWIRSVAFSPDGKRLASGSSDNTVRMWDGATGAHVATLTGHRGWIRSVAFSSDGKRLASGSEDKTVRMWDGATGAHVATLTGHDRSIRSVAFSSDGKRLASGSSDGTVRMWDGATGAHVATLTGHNGWIASVAFSSDGKRLASGSDDKTVRMWDGATAGAHVATLTGHDRSIRSVAFSSDGKRLASVSSDNTVRMWDGATGAHVATLTGHHRSIRSVAFSPDGKRLASGSEDKTVRMWDGATGAHVATLTGHHGWIRSVAFSSDGKRLASGSSDNTVRMWDGATGAHVATLTGHRGWIRSVAFSSDGKRLASGSEDKTVRMWDGATGAHVATLTGHDRSIRSVAFSPDGKRLVSGSSDGSGSSEAKQWDVSTATEIINPPFQSPLPKYSLPSSPPNLDLQTSHLDLVNRDGLQAVIAVSSQASLAIPICFLPVGSQVWTSTFSPTHGAVGLGTGRLYILNTSQVRLT